MLCGGVLGSSVSTVRKSIIALAIGLCVTVQASAGAERGWLIRQQSPFSVYSGNQNVYLTKTRLKMQGSNVRLFYESKTREIEVYNTATKEFYSGPAQSWIKKYVNLPKEKFVEATKRTKMIAGKQALLFYLSKNESTGVHRLREVWATESILVPEDMCKVMWGLCGLHAAPGVPMRVMRLLDRGKTEMLLDTLEVSEAKFNEKDFVRPKGFKRVKNELELLLHASDTGSATDMLGK